jgi:hypothetical protein
MHPHAATQAVASDHTSYRGGLQSHHVSRVPGPHLLTEVSSGAATWPVVLGLISLLS